ncbi:MAG: 5'/3'-nucleotidase SurE [Chloroflexi bacterium]|nr:5'/3'-nucleotidase SurE [Chloroflexota bacterium]
MRILVTNDDGAHAPGLWALVRAVRPLGDIVVSAPDRDRSGVGPALSLNELIRAKELVSPMPDVKVFAVEGTPGDAAVLGLRHLVPGKIDLAISGINPGTNVGEDVIISGTVGAAAHAYLNGVPTLAVSTSEGLRDIDHPVVGRVITAISPDLAALREPSPLYLNVNFPPLGKAGPTTALRTRVAARFLEDKVEAIERGYRTYYWLLRRGGRSVDSAHEGTDVWAVQNGYISISPVYTEFAGGDVNERVDAIVKKANAALRGA